MTRWDLWHWFKSALVMMLLSALIAGLVNGLALGFGYGRVINFDPDRNMLVILLLAALDTVIRVIREVRT